MIKHKTEDLFTAPKGVYLAHACNCQGKWNSGVALEFKKRFPESFKTYKRFCGEGASPGDLLVCAEENGYQVVCLFTSNDYGFRVDAPKDILEATRLSLDKMFMNKPLHMPKINSGLFNVPWEKTEKVLSEFKDLDITVYSLK